VRDTHLPYWLIDAVLTEEEEGRAHFAHAYMLALEYLATGQQQVRERGLC